MNHTPADPLIAAVDVDYRDGFAVAAGVWFRGWAAESAEFEATAVVREVAEYTPGEFYRRELPCLLAVLAGGPPADLVIVDGYVGLGDGRPGLGAYLFDALGGGVPVVGVAKTRFASAEAVPVCRGGSRSPLWVTATGMDVDEAAGRVAEMTGPYRVPALLKRADQLARTAMEATSPGSTAAFLHPSTRPVSGAIGVEAFTDDEVIAALSYAGVPTGLHAEFVAFQRKHGGRADAFGLNAVRWGVLHRSPEWLEAGRIEAEPDDERAGVWHVYCADVHPSDTMTIDQAGRLYWCWRVRYRHYDDYFAGQPPLDWSAADT